MTVGRLKELLQNFNDTDRLVIDNGEYKATSANEIIFAYKIRTLGEPSARPIVIFQTKNDFDVPNELEEQLTHFKEAYGEDYSDAENLSELFELGFVLDDFKYDQDRYNWAKKVAEDNGLLHK